MTKRQTMGRFASDKEMEKCLAIGTAWLAATPEVEKHLAIGAAGAVTQYLFDTFYSDYDAKIAAFDEFAAHIKKNLFVRNGRDN